MRLGLFRLIPACTVAACAAGEVVLPPAPDSASASAQLGRVTLTWSAVEDATSYVVVASQDPSLTSENAGELVGAQRIAVPAPPLELALDPGTWYFRVSALAGGFRSPDSALLEATPLVAGTGGLAPLATPAWIGTAAQVNARFGFPVAGAGDVDGDGFDDVLIGAFELGSGGVASFYRGSPVGLDAAPTWTASAVNPGDQFSKGLAAVGDITGDGQIDVIVGATEWANPEIGEGRTSLFLGSAGSFALSASWFSESDQSTTYQSRFVAPLGDVNGDTLADFVIDRHNYAVDLNNEGCVLAFYGRSGLPPAVADVTLQGDQLGALLGYALSMRPGDSDGDGYDDLLTGAFSWNEPGRNNAGQVRLYRGGPAGIEAAASWTFEGEAANDELGNAVSFAGDVNGDGFDDAIFGAHGANADNGRVYVVLGSPAGFGAPVWTYDGEGGEHLGMGAGAAGDVNADGYADIAVGGYLHAGGTGRVLFFLGGPGGPAAAPALVFAPGHPAGYAGGHVASAGDVNGDGSDDLLVGTVSFEFLTVDSKVYLFLGAPSRSPSVTIAAVEAGAGAPTVVPASIADAGTGPLTCTWDFGDGGVIETITPCDAATAGAPSHTWVSPGTFVLRLRATNAHGAAGEAFAHVRVSD